MISVHRSDNFAKPVRRARQACTPRAPSHDFKSWDPRFVSNEGLTTSDKLPDVAAHFQLRARGCRSAAAGQTTSGNRQAHGWLASYAPVSACAHFICSATTDLRIDVVNIKRLDIWIGHLAYTIQVCGAPLGPERGVLYHARMARRAQHL